MRADLLRPPPPMFLGCGRAHRMFSSSSSFDGVSVTGTGLPQTYGFDQVQCTVCTSAGKCLNMWVFVHRSKSPNVLLSRTGPKDWLAGEGAGSRYFSREKDLKLNECVVTDWIISWFPCQQPSSTFREMNVCSQCSVIVPCRLVVRQKTGSPASVHSLSALCNFTITSKIKIGVGRETETVASSQALTEKSRQCLGPYMDQRGEADCADSVVHSD